VLTEAQRNILRLIFRWVPYPGKSGLFPSLSAHFCVRKDAIIDFFGEMRDEVMRADERRGVAKGPRGRHESKSASPPRVHRVSIQDLDLPGSETEDYVSEAEEEDPTDAVASSRRTEGPVPEPSKASVKVAPQGKKVVAATMASDLLASSEAWLNDIAVFECLEVHVRQVLREGNKVALRVHYPISLTLLLRKLDEGTSKLLRHGIQLGEVLLVPVCKGMHHWFLCAILHGRVLVLDSLGVVRHRPLLAALKAFYGREVQDPGAVYQRDGCHCGVWLVAAANAVIKWDPRQAFSIFDYYADIVSSPHSAEDMYALFFSVCSRSRFRFRSRSLALALALSPSRPFAISLSRSLALSLPRFLAPLSNVCVFPSL
jgi:hypothetical protein